MNNKEKLQRIQAVKSQSKWRTCVERLGLFVKKCKNSHLTVWKNKEEAEENNVQKMVATIQKDIRPDVNEGIFDNLVEKSGKTEEEILRAVKILKGNDTVL